MSDTLARICDDKRKHIATCQARRPMSALEAAARQQSPPRGFAGRLRAHVDAGRYGLIAEIKKASPSKGLIRPDFDPPSLARAYADGGAACLSVLTDTPYFQGRDDDLVAARAAVDLPVLRKDFILDPYQVVEARAIGADCILLIMAALADKEARELAAVARLWNLDVLVEVHDEDEMDRAAAIGADLIGINNRNLKTLSVDLATTEKLAPRAPQSALLVCESGLSTPEDLARMAACGTQCFLVGESLMRHKDVTAATRNLLSGQAPRRVRA